MRILTLPTSRRWRCGAALVAGLVLQACTTAPDFSESNRLLAEGKPEEALRVLESAAKAQPRSPEVYNAFVMQRTALAAAYVRDADDLRARREFDPAEAQYRNALRVDPMSEAATAGLAALQRERRADATATEAYAALQRGDLASAERLARSVLADSPSNRSARAVMKGVTEQRVRTEMAEPRLVGLGSRQVSLELRDAPLRHVFDILAREGGLNFILDREVRSDARANIAVRDSNLEDVLKMLLLTNQLERKVLNENTLLIYQATPAKQREYQDLVMRNFYLANADAKTTAAMIRAMVKTRDLYIDDKLNLVIMRDTPDAVRLAEQLVATQDLPEPEVMLEVEVLEVASALLQDFGFTYPTQINVFGNPDASGTPPVVFPIGSSTAFKAFIANPALQINLRRSDGTSNLLANPRIRVKNREKAHVHIGERVPVITTTSTANVGVSSSVNYLETGLKLDVEPNVLLEDEVAIKISLEVSNILEQLNISGTVAYRLGTRNAATTLRLKDGETQVLAGLINNQDRRAVAKVPYVGEVPVFGRLFRSDSDQTSKSEIVLLITPRVVRNIQRPDNVPSQYPSGTEALPGGTPLRLTAARTPVFSFGAPQAGGAATAAAAGAPAQAVPLVVAAPSVASVGDEFTVRFTLNSGNQPASAIVNVTYNPGLLRLVDPGGDARAAAAPAGASRTATAGVGTSTTAPSAPAPPLPPDSGRASVEVSSKGLAGQASPTSELRFRVVATAAAQTELAFDVSSSEAIATPPPHPLNIVGK